MEKWTNKWNTEQAHDKIKREDIETRPDQEIMGEDLAEIFQSVWNLTNPTKQNPRKVTKRKPKKETAPPPETKRSRGSPKLKAHKGNMTDVKI